MRDSETGATASEAIEHWDVYVHVRTDLLVVAGGIVAGATRLPGARKKVAGRPELVGGLVSPFPLSRWLRRGMERVVHRYGGTVCHPREPTPSDAIEPEHGRALPDGYHRTGACAESVNTDGACVVFELFGDRRTRRGQLMRRPIRFHPDRSRVDYANGEACGRYRRLDRTSHRRDAADATARTEHSGVDAVVDFEGCWRLTFRKFEPAYVGLLAAAVDVLDERSGDVRHQLGERRNEGAGIVDCELLNPLYDDRELRAAFDSSADPTDAMSAKDERWAEEFRPALVAALEERLAAWP